jgi:hypothetical protein
MKKNEKRDSTSIKNIKNLACAVSELRTGVERILLDHCTFSAV